MIAAVLECCAGIDVAKKTLNVCLMKGPADGEPDIELRKFGTFNSDLARLRDWLAGAGCTHVVMESTGSYWKPVYEVLEEKLAVILANGEDVKGRRGQKTDWKDCQLLAHLLRHGMVEASFIPPRPVRDLRDLTRRRRRLVSHALSERNRVAKVLEEANVKLGSVLSNLFGVSGQLMLEKLLSGEPDVVAIADLAQKSARGKIPLIIEALRGHRMSDHHRRLIQYSLEHLAFLEAQIGEIDAEVLRRVEAAGYQQAFELLQSVPGVQQIAAAAILAETGPDMQVFPTPGNLSSWAGVSPGNRISAGKNKNGHTCRGNRWFRTTLVECAWAASLKKGCFLKDRFWKLAPKGRKLALVAIAHTLAILVWKTLATRVPYREAEEEQMDERKRQRLIRHYARRLGRLGVNVSGLRPAPSRSYRTSTGTLVLSANRKPPNKPTGAQLTRNQ